MRRTQAAFAAQVLGAAMLLNAPPPRGVATPPGALEPTLVPGVSTPAPVPDESVSEPAPVPDRGPAATVSPGITYPGLGPSGTSQGYTPHSSYTDTLDKRFRPAPMLNLSVKLQ